MGWGHLGVVDLSPLVTLQVLCPRYLLPRLRAEHAFNTCECNKEEINDDDDDDETRISCQWYIQLGVSDTHGRHALGVSGQHNRALRCASLSLAHTAAGTGKVCPTLSLVLAGCVGHGELPGVYIW